MPFLITSVNDLSLYFEQSGGKHLECGASLKILSVMLLHAFSICLKFWQESKSISLCISTCSRNMLVFKNLDSNEK